MSIRENARINLEKAGLFKKDSDYNGMIGEAVMKLVDLHCSEGHSGMSHELTIAVFNKVIRDHALTKEYYEHKKQEMIDFAIKNMGEPWKPHILEEMLGPKPGDK